MNAMWVDRAACRGRADAYRWTDTDARTPDPDALALCMGCKVREVCLSVALDAEYDPGVWGGTSEADRERVRRRQLTVSQAMGRGDARVARARQDAA